MTFLYLNEGKYKKRPKSRADPRLWLLGYWEPTGRGAVPPRPHCISTLRFSLSSMQSPPPAAAQASDSHPQRAWALKGGLDPMPNLGTVLAPHQEFRVSSKKQTQTLLRRWWVSERPIRDDGQRRDS